MSISRTCKIENCEGVFRAKGYCSLHYKRIYYPTIKDLPRKITKRTGLTVNNRLEWNIYSNIRYRCENPKSVAYKNYGARGISMQESWRGNFEGFLIHIQQLPHYREEGYTLDRIDNDRGYEEGNLRWATRNVQTYNQRVKKTNTTGYTGVSKLASGRYIARVGVNGKKINLGVYDDASTAGTVVRNYRSKVLKGIMI